MRVNMNNETAKVVPRRKALGDLSTLSQVESFLDEYNVSQGNFVGLQAGDWFTIGNKYVAYIAGFDTEYAKGESQVVTSHHITCIINLGNSKMNTSATTTGGYAGATVMQSFLDTKATELRNIAGNHILNRQVLLSDAVTGDRSSGFSWYYKYLTLLSENQVYGCQQWAANGFDVGEACEKLPVFNEITPWILLGRNFNSGFWLRNVRTSVRFTYCSKDGYPAATNADNEVGVIALFCLG